MLQTRSLPSCFSSLIPILACDPQETFPDSLVEVGPTKYAVTSSGSALCLCQVNFSATITHLTEFAAP